MGVSRSDRAHQSRFPSSSALRTTAAELISDQPNVAFTARAGQTCPRSPANQRRRFGKYSQNHGSTLSSAAAYLYEYGVVFDVGARLQDTLGYEERAAGGDVHLRHGPPEAAAAGVWLKGVTKVFPGGTLVHQHQRHLTDTQATPIKHSLATEHRRTSS